MFDFVGLLLLIFTLAETMWMNNSNRLRKVSISPFNPTFLPFSLCLVIFRPLISTHFTHFNLFQLDSIYSNSSSSSSPFSKFILLLNIIIFVFSHVKNGLPSDFCRWQSQVPPLICEHCGRPGHNVQGCRTRIREARETLNTINSMARTVYGKYYDLTFS